ncbi:MAG: HDOD domain-containing protein [Spirochaetes bacterium]|nr:HDOD domain-containing protein [Spirochaetota bacterium]
MISSMIAQKTSQLSQKLDAGEPVVLSFFYHNKFNVQFLNSFITKVLSRNNMLYLRDSILTVLKELIVNAVKANSKRLFFSSQNLDITSPEEYLHGMKLFKTFIVDKKSQIEEDLKDANLRVRVHFKKYDGELHVIVRNDCSMLPEEMQRVQDRIEKAKQYNDFSEVYEDMCDDSEGEGLGLLLTILFLKNSGINPNSLKIESKDNSTQASFVIPKEIKPHIQQTRIKNKILEEVSDLPSFPENVIELIRMCKRNDVSIKDIGQRIMLDPALSASVLKLANSAGFITRKRIDNIFEAINIIGLKNLNIILIASSARNILSERYSEFKEMWNHSNRVAFYSRAVAIQKGFSKIADPAFLAGLLHDLGKIILLSVTARLVEWIADITKNRDMRTSTIIEEISIGISHASIGAAIAEKWNLPHYIVETIKHHHSPLCCDHSFMDIVGIVYLANLFAGIETGKYEYPYIEDDILELLALQGEGSAESFHKNIRRMYEEHMAIATNAS